MQKKQKHRSAVFWKVLPVIALVVFRSTPIMAATAAEIQQWLQAHNTYRALHGVPPVTWSATVAASAQAWADTCPSGHSGSGYGENMAFSSPASYNPGVETIVQWWYDEEPLYDYSNPGFSSDTGHFTQVVWKGTTEIGCGFKSGCSTGSANVWVCQYNPPGNYTGQFAANVFPPNSGGGGGSPRPSAETVVPILPLLLLR